MVRGEVVIGSRQMSMKEHFRKNRLSSLDYFRKNVPSQIFDKVLSTIMQLCFGIICHSSESFLPEPQRGEESRGFTSRGFIQSKYRLFS